MLGDERLQLFGVGPGKLVHDLLVLDEQERRHAGDVVLGGEVLALVHVHLDDDDLLRELVLELVQLRGDHLARAAPGGEKVHHDQLLAGGLQSAVEVSLRNGIRRK